MKRIAIGALLMGALFVGYSVGYRHGAPKDISKELEKVDEIEYTKHIQASNYNDDVLRNIGNGTLRLFINSDSKETAGVDDGKRTHCNIHESDARRIIEITKRADECSTRLNGLQEWVNTHIK